MHDLFEHLLANVKAIWRYRWFAAAVAWFIAVAGWVAVASLADRYQASSRVYVDTQSILRPLLAGLTMQPKPAKFGKGSRNGRNEHPVQGRQ